MFFVLSATASPTSAATILIGIFSVFNAFRTPQIETVKVATIQKSFGSIYMVGESSELAEIPNLFDLSSGQTVFTGDDAGIALAWNNGGSLRIANEPDGKRDTNR